MKSVNTKISMTDEQYRIFQMICSLGNSTEQEYIGNALISMMGADIDAEFKAGDPRRDEFFEKIGWLRIRSVA
jgi:hypothetical protein